MPREALAISWAEQLTSIAQTFTDFASEWVEQASAHDDWDELEKGWYELTDASL